MQNENSTLQKGRTTTDNNGQQSTNDVLVPIKVVLKYLGISKSTFYKYDIGSKIPHYYIDNTKSIARFKLSDVEAYLQQNR